MIVIPFWLKRIMNSNGLTVADLKDVDKMSQYISKQDMELLGEINRSENIGMLDHAFMDVGSEGDYLNIPHPFITSEQKIRDRKTLLEALIGLPVNEDMYQIGFSPECVDGTMYLHVGVVDKKDPNKILHGNLNEKMRPYGKELIGRILELCYVNKTFGNHPCGPVAAMARSELMTAFTRF